MPKKFRKLLAKLIFGKAFTYSTTLPDLGGSESAPDKTYENTANAQIYATLATVYAAVYAIANTMAQIRPKVSREKRSGTIEDLSMVDHPLQHLLDRPNPWDTRYEFLEAFTAFPELSGDGFITLEGDGKFPEEMYVQKSQDMKVIPDAQQRVKGYTIAINGQEQPLDPEEVIHLKTFSPLNQLVGQASMDAARLAVLCELYAISVNKGFLQNGAQLSGILETEDEIEPTLRRVLEKEFNATYAGAGNSGKIRLATHGLKFKPTSSTFKDMMFPELRNKNREEILAAFGVSPIIIGSLDGASYANAEQQIMQFWRACMLPKIRRFDARMTHSLAIKFGADLRIAMDLSDVEALQADKKLIVEIGERMLRNGAMTSNELRQWIATGDLPTLDELPAAFGDTVWVPTSLVPASFNIDAPTNGKALTGPRDKRSVEEVIESLERRAKEALSRGKVCQEVNKALADARLKNFGRQWKAGVKFMRPKAARILKAQVKAVVDNLDKIVSDPSQNGAGKQALHIDAFGSRGADILLTASTEAPTATVESVIQELIDRHTDTWKDVAGEVVEGSADAVLGELGIDVEFSLQAPEVSDWLDSESSKLIKDVSAESIRIIQVELEAGVAEGESISVLADRIKSKGAQMARYRANRIARTETTSALNFGALAGYKETDGVVELKEWQDAGDDLVRGGDPGDEFDHTDVTGPVKLNQAFYVSGEPAQYPGDSSLSAGNRIECRCALLPVVSEKSANHLQKLIARSKNTVRIKV